MIKKQYIAPSLTSVEFKTERGYCASTLAGDLHLYADYISAGANNLAMGAQMGDVSGYFNDVSESLHSPSSNPLNRTTITPSGADAAAPNYFGSPF